MAFVEQEKTSVTGMTVDLDFEFEKLERVRGLMLNEKDLLRSSKGPMLGEEGVFVGELMETELLAFVGLRKGIMVEQDVVGGESNCQRRSHG